MNASNITTISKKREGTKRVPKIDARTPYSPLSFSEVETTARLLADLIESRFDELAEILLSYESFEVVQDETARTLDLLKNLRENKKYFRLRINEVTSFLPRNQPLYSFTCFVLVPSLMAHKVHFRIPHSMRSFFPKLMTLLEIHRLFPNVVVSNLTRLEFLRNRSALRVDPRSGESTPVTDAVIFTGTSAHANQLRLIFDNRTLFISNGAGHNPVVVSDDAEISKAVGAVLDIQLYNQGQDCSAPNAVLVHHDIFHKFHDELCKRLRDVRVGMYKDRSNRIGPISDPKDILKIQDFLIEHRAWLDPQTPGVIRTRDAIVEPTIICKPLIEGGNFGEIFAPVIFLQEYNSDAVLSLYFESPHYARGAMFVTLYGTSKYIDALENKESARVRTIVLRNINPHDLGVERGTQPYGGYGNSVSGVAICGKSICKPTLPQRDIYEWIVKPIMQKSSLGGLTENLGRFTKIEKKNVEKLLRLISIEPQKSEEIQAGEIYVDVRALKIKRGARFARIDEKHSCPLLARPNAVHIATLQPTDIVLIRGVRKLLSKRTSLSFDAFNSALYKLPTSPDASKRENRIRQLRLFKHLYQLLLGKDSGPRLSHFLLDIDIKNLRKLLDA